MDADGSVDSDVTLVMCILCAGPVTFHMIRRPASASARPVDTLQGVASLETEKFCPCLVELNPGLLN